MCGVTWERGPTPRLLVPLDVFSGAVTFFTSAVSIPSLELGTACLCEIQRL